MADVLERYFACIFYAVIFVCVTGAISGILANLMMEFIGDVLPEEIIGCIAPILLSMAFSFLLCSYFRESYETVYGTYIDVVFTFILILVFRYILSNTFHVSDLSVITGFIFAMLTAASVNFFFWKRTASKLKKWTTVEPQQLSHLKQGGVKSFIDPLSLRLWTPSMHRCSD